MARHDAKPMMPVIATAELRQPPPEDYAPSRLVDPFEVWAMPLVHRGDAGSYEEDRAQWLGFHVDERHLDGRGRCHRGMLAAFADSVLSCRVWTANDRKPCVTISMSLSHEGHAVEGDFVEGTAKVVRKTRDLIFADARFLVGPDRIMSVASVWKILGDNYRIGG